MGLPGLKMAYRMDAADGTLLEARKRIATRRMSVKIVITAKTSAAPSDTPRHPSLYAVVIQPAATELQT
jgi:hypothetical protein